VGSPGAPDRNGRPGDTDNMVTLICEMRTSFGSRFGISMAISTSWWYLRWFKPKELEPHVNFFGVMTYDLHGPWDKNIKQIGAIVYGQTNLPEIANWTLPLWYAGVNPAKVNLKLAY
jgi:chitinase